MFCLICVIVIDTAKKRLNYAPLHSLTHALARQRITRFPISAKSSVDDDVVVEGGKFW